MKSLLIFTISSILLFQVPAQSVKNSDSNGIEVKPVLSCLHTLSIHVRDTVTHDSVFHFLTDKLRLPVYYYPHMLGKRRYAGAYTGNIVLEPCGPYTNFRYANYEFRAIFFGLTFETPISLPKAAFEISERGIKTGNAGGRYLAINDSLLTGENILISLSEVNNSHKRIFDSLKLEMQEEAGNGPGIEYVKTILIGYKENSGLQKWEQLVKPARISGNIWKQVDNPEFLFSPGNIKEVKGIVFKVKSLKKARRYLEKTGLLGTSSGKRISIDKSKAFGLSIYLEE